MKTFKEIKRLAEKGDYQRVSEIVGMSDSIVKKVVYGLRNDHHNIQKVFSDLIENRERLSEREERRRIRKALREQKLQAA